MIKVIILLLLPAFSMCQQKHDNAIIVKNISLKTAIGALMDDGYTIGKYDTLMGFVTTDAKSVKNSFTVILSVRIKDSVTVVTGTVRDNVTMQPFSGIKVESVYSPIEYRGMKGSVLRNSFDEMQAFALRLSSQVEYKKL